MMRFNRHLTTSLTSSALGLWLLGGFAFAQSRISPLQGGGVLEEATESANEATEEAGSAMKDAKEKAGSAMEDAKEAAGSAMEEAKEKAGSVIDSTKETLKDAAEEAKESAQDLKEDIQDAMQDESTDVKAKAKGELKNGADAATGKLDATGNLKSNRSGRASLGVSLTASTGAGVYVPEVVTGSPAERAGIRNRDYILSIDGTDINSPREF